MKQIGAEVLDKQGVRGDAGKNVFTVLFVPPSRHQTKEVGRVQTASNVGSSQSNSQKHANMLGALLPSPVCANKEHG